MTSDSLVQAHLSEGSAGAVDDLDRTVDWRRLVWAGRGVALIALSAMVLGAILAALSTVVSGRLAANPSWSTVAVLAGYLLGSAVFDTAGRTVWAAMADRAEGRLRGDLLTAALRQPLARLSEQAVGEIIDRVDDDAQAVGGLARHQTWDALRTLTYAVPMWIVAGLTWWPAWIIFPVVAPLTVLIVRPLLQELKDRKVEEEAAWTDHAAVVEEAIAARDDLRTSLGQGYVLRRAAELSGVIQRRFRAAVAVESRITIRAGGVLQALLAGVLLAGVALVVDGHLGVAELVTLVLVSATLVGEIAGLARQLPDLQAGMGAVIRLRQFLAAESEPVGGAPVPDGPIDIVFDNLHFSYAEGTFALGGIQLRIEAGTTCGIVGRTGSGKSTLASLVSRAVEPQRGSLYFGGTDVCDLDLHGLRSAVGVVTQRTEIIAGTLADNIALFADVPRERVQSAISELDLTDWVGSLPEGLDTTLGPGGTTLSAGEEQLVAFARLFVRDVGVVILDEATARMDRLTETRMIRAADRLLARRTGIVIAHRLSTVARADRVVVLDHGRIVDEGIPSELESRPGPFRRLLDASGAEIAAVDPPSAAGEDTSAIGGARRPGSPVAQAEVDAGPSLARGIARVVMMHPRWGLFGSVLFLLTWLVGNSANAVTGYLWGHVIQTLHSGSTPALLTLATGITIAAQPFLLAWAVRCYSPWWCACVLRIRLAVLAAQTQQRRLARTPPGEVVARLLDADRFLRYADRWNEVISAVLIVVITSLLSGTMIAGAILLAVMVAAAITSVAGRSIAGQSAASASASRAAFGSALVATLECVRTIKLAAATDDVHAHLTRVDRGRVDAAVREHRVQSILALLPVVTVQLGVLAAWAVYLCGGWSLAAALLVSGAVLGFDYFGSVVAAAVTEAPGTRAWQQATSRFAGGSDLMDIPPGIDLVAATAPPPAEPSRIPLRRLELRNVAAIHDDGTRGAIGVDLTIEAGELVLLLGQIGSGKSSLLAALCGLVDHTGDIRWNGVPIGDAQIFLRPGQVAYVAQVPRVLSGSFADNVRLDHDRAISQAIDSACLADDIEEAGGVDALVGHRGVRLSGGQAQRLALARALATESELLLADDISSALDATTEVQLWTSLRAHRTTVIGATSKRAALAQADRVVVLVNGEIAAIGPWVDLARSWDHLAG
ncbi:ATP-binding cassette subfamily B protein [Mycobacterium frederiksbergense]|uniref:ATP-binding cassette subfamily B protein n=1 Tax=Mycolicibacterium frederiksbergense TaxID=117567 RepID=A0ABT6KZF6_9MYCO|nr:ABC transporter ATP-binding protein [Mycolicibacterium frederiksbergense]MDH6196076.1 ATP-binding cassette subfamily B protein [Mycolicibacterium frederiksbergense]